MSRTIAKTYRICRTNTWAKRFASHVVRKAPIDVEEWDIPDGGFFRKMYPSWDINDGGRARPIERKIRTEWELEWTTKASRK